MAALAGVGILGTARLASGQPSSTTETSSVTVLMLNNADVDRQELRTAQAVASQVYAAAGLTLVWTELSAMPPTSTFQLAMSIGVGAKMIGTWPSASVLGAAPGANVDNYRGQMAYAFYDRIRRFARKHRVDVAPVLGHVMAHEMGHQLLGRREHSPSGIMRGFWQQGDVVRMVGRHTLTFTDEEANVLRVRALAK